jgi:hypothetical protein
VTLKSGWNRRSFLAALGSISGGLLAPVKLNAEGMFTKKPKLSATPIDGNPIVPIFTRSWV